MKKDLREPLGYAAVVLILLSVIEQRSTTRRRHPCPPPCAGAGTLVAGISGNLSYL